ncbi:GntR family transcriptional regulator [Mesorhizobium sp. IMUNJ 23033]|uniref:GntR family transcriptional regulator n=1 Tax=Mesorhizobium TaxID=68287 RepID=UPI001780923C|nr:GntR family transcriptional regulator [Mesorhizobium silamurunense]
MSEKEEQTAGEVTGAEGLTGALYRQLRDRIVRHHIRPGQRLDPRRLADDFKVSAAPVRDAVNRLTGEGLVQHVPSKGYFVRPITVARLIEAYEMIFVMLRHGVEFSRVPFDTEGLQRVPKIATFGDEAPVMTDEAAKQYGSFVEMLFERIAAMAGTDIVRSVIRYYLDQTHYARVHDLLDSEYLGVVVEQMTRLMTSLTAGDRTAALAVMGELLDEKLKRLPSLVNEIERQALERDPLFRARSEED